MRTGSGDRLRRGVERQLGRRIVGLGPAAMGCGNRLQPRHCPRRRPGTRRPSRFRRREPLIQLAEQPSRAALAAPGRRRPAARCRAPLEGFHDVVAGRPVQRPFSQHADGIDLLVVRPESALIEFGEELGPAVESHRQPAVVGSRRRTMAWGWSRKSRWPGPLAEAGPVPRTFKTLS